MNPETYRRASIVYVKEQMGHSSIQVTVDTYGHLIPGANVCFVDRLDEVSLEKAEATAQQFAIPAQQDEMQVPLDLLQVVDEIWWRRVDSNHGPTDYETVALAT